MSPKSAFRLSMDPAISKFAPEIRYVCALLREAHGLIEHPDATRILHYGDDPPPGAATVPSALFRVATADADGLHLDSESLASIAPFLLPGPDAAAFDAIGLVFLLVTRLEERDSGELDRYGRFPATADFQVRHGLFGRAAADEALAALARLISGNANPPNATSYRLQPTHDVDRLRAYHKPFDPIRHAAGDLLKRGRPGNAIRRLASYASREPWTSFDDVMRLSEEFGLISRFYFMGPSGSPYDSPYAMSMPQLLGAVAADIVARGHIPGFHPGHDTSRNAAEWARQRAGLEAVLGCTVTEGRQHMLCYSAAETPEIWDSNGMQADYSLAYPEHEGFRTGSSRVFPAYSLRHRRQLALRQGSTAIMDFGLFGGKYRNLDVETALARCRPVIEVARRFGGTLTVLFHTGQAGGTVRKFYAELLREAT